jgi:hypothetical protein
MVWLKPTTEGTPPAPREGASMAMLGGKVAVFGGHGSKQRFNDLYLLDTEVRKELGCRCLNFLVLEEAI